MPAIPGQTAVAPHGDRVELTLMAREDSTREGFPAPLKVRMSPRRARRLAAQLHHAADALDPPLSVNGNGT